MGVGSAALSRRLWRRSGGGWLQCHQPRHAHQVVRRGYEVTRQLGPLQSAVARSAEAPDRLQPAEYLLNSFPQALASVVAGMPSGAPIDGAPPATGVLCDVRRHAVLAHGRHTRACVVGFVGAERPWMKAAQCGVV